MDNNNNLDNTAPGRLQAARNPKGQQQ